MTNGPNTTAAADSRPVDDLSSTHPIPCLLAKYRCTRPAAVEEIDPRYPDQEPLRWCVEDALLSAGDALRDGRTVTLRPIGGRQ